jgi:hypothetical protein
MHQARLTFLFETMPEPLGLPITHTHQAARRRHTQLALLNRQQHHHPFSFLAAH